MFGSAGSDTVGAVGRVMDVSTAGRVGAPEVSIAPGAVGMFNITEPLNVGTSTSMLDVSMLGSAGIAGRVILMSVAFEALLLTPPLPRAPPPPPPLVSGGMVGGAPSDGITRDPIEPIAEFAAVTAEVACDVSESINPCAVLDAPSGTEGKPEPVNV
jgi:hypothetical protein